MTSTVHQKHGVAVPARARNFEAPAPRGKGPGWPPQGGRTEVAGLCGSHIKKNSKLANRSSAWHLQHTHNLVLQSQPTSLLEHNFDASRFRAGSPGIWAVCGGAISLLPGWTVQCDGTNCCPSCVGVYVKCPSHAWV